MAREDQINQATDELLVRMRQPNDRLFSWDHCNRFFHGLVRNPDAEQIDRMALHLAFYLASYGMYRGSTAVLGKDYKFLIPVVHHLVNENSGAPSNSVEAATNEVQAEAAWGQIFSLKGILLNLNIEQKNLDTLATKIVLGTWATAPAFDNSFRNAIKAAGIGAATFSKKNFLRVFSFVHEHRALFQRQVVRFHNAGFTHYPAIRVVDAIVWHLGGGDETESKL
jgi:hypothetical protein